MNEPHIRIYFPPPKRQRRLVRSLTLLVALCGIGLLISSFVLFYLLMHQIP